MEARGVSNDILDMVLAEVKVHHDCGYSVACPGWWCMGMVQRKMTRSRPECWKDAEQKKETLPEGRNPLKRGREPDGEWGELEEVRRARTTSSTVNHQNYPQEVKDIIPEGRK